MNKLIARLMDCGISRSVALCVCRSFSGRLRDFELYVEQVEEECREPMEVFSE